MTSVTARPGAADLLSPFDVVAHAVPAQRRSKRQLLTASRTLERRALAARVDTVLVTFQDRRHLTPASRDAYAGLARSGATVHAFARGLTSDYRPGSAGLSHVALLPQDPLALEWDIVVLGRTFSAAFVARDLTPGTAVAGPDLDRPFSWTQTEDPALVQACADHLLSRLP
ncbi:MAG: sensor-containing diguanylate cyclase/phosphodiesterase [Frankiales bacterium]|nr:sensor-containing diguanylate cyclase/phosphodiesterase [Frankiales bacterium]